MTWPIVHGEVTSLPQIQPLSQAQDDYRNVPMEVREIHANRFVCHLAGLTVKPELPEPSSRALRWTRRVVALKAEVEAQFQPGALVVGPEWRVAQVGHLVPPRGQMNF